jgi:hypothetical protein
MCSVLILDRVRVHLGLLSLDFHCAIVLVDELCVGCNKDFLVISGLQLGLLEL